MYEKRGDSWTKISDKGLAFLTQATGGADGYIEFARPGEESHQEVEDYKKAHAGGVVTIPLHTNEFIATYDMDLGPYNGNGDITAEAKNLVVDRDGGSGDVDVRLLGRPYIYKGQKHPGLTHSGCGDKADALNHVSSRAYNFKNLAKAINDYVAADFSGVHQGANDWRGSQNASVEHRNRDTAYYLGYLIPFGYHSSLTVNRDGNNYHSYNQPDIADYQADNLTPESVRYEVRFKNINDVHEGVDDENRAAHISAVTLRAHWEPVYYNPNHVSGNNKETMRVQKIYVPAQFVTVGGHTRNDNWFRAQDFSFTVYNVATDHTATVKLTWNDMVNLGMLSGTVSGTGTAATFAGNINTTSRSTCA